MKRVICYCSILFLLLFSCAKQAGTSGYINTTSNIIGKWHVIKDSMYQGVAAANHLVVYDGQEEDYFDFRQDGKAYTKEGTNYDTLNYKLSGFSDIIIDSFPNSTHYAVTTNNLSIISPEYASPGGMVKRCVYLNR